MEVGWRSPTRVSGRRFCSTNTFSSRCGKFTVSAFVSTAKFTCCTPRFIATSVFAVASPLIPTSPSPTLKRAISNTSLRRPSG